MAHTIQRGTDDSAQQVKLMNKRLERMSWGLFLIMLGGIWLVPESMVPGGAWLIGAGIIMLGLNFARYLNGIPVSSFTLVLGAIALLVGIGDSLGADLPIVPILLILIGASILVAPQLERRRARRRER